MDGAWPLAEASWVGWGPLWLRLGLKLLLPLPVGYYSCLPDPCSHLGPQSLLQLRCALQRPSAPGVWEGEPGPGSGWEAEWETSAGIPLGICLDSAAPGGPGPGKVSASLAGLPELGAKTLIRSREILGGGGGNLGTSASRLLALNPSGSPSQSFILHFFIFHFPQSPNSESPTGAVGPRFLSTGN